VQGWFDKKYPFELVAKSIGDTNERLKWDRNIASTQFLQPIAKNAYVCRNVTQKLPIISVRDVVEKKIVIRYK